MSDAIRDVTIRVKILQEQVTLASGFAAMKNELIEIQAMQRDMGQQAESKVLASPATLAEQAAGFKSISDSVKEMDVSIKAATAADPFANLDASVNRLKGDMQEQAATFTVVENAAQRNFQAMLNVAQAESTAERAIRQTTTAQKAMNIELITATGSALRSAAASGDYASVTAQLGQALIYTLRGLAQQTAGNAAAATSAGTAGAASEFQAVAIGHVSAAGARAATTNAALAASNAAAGGSAAAATPAIAGMVTALGPIAMIVTGITVAVAVGKMAWDAYKESTRTAADDVRDAVKQRLDAEKQSNAIEAALDEERRKRRGLQLQLIDQQIEKEQKLKTTRDLALQAEQQSLQGRVALFGDDPNHQLAMLRQRSVFDQSVRDYGHGLVKFNGGDLTGARVGAAALNVANNAAYNNRNLSGTGLLNANEKQVDFLKLSLSFLDDERQKEEQILGIKRQQLQAGQQDASNLRARLSTIQEMIAAEQGRLQSAAERFAQMDPGEQARLKDIATKAKGGGELNLQEAQALSQSGLGQGFASQAFERIANKAGFNEVAGNLGEFNQIQQLRFKSNSTQEAINAAERLNNETKEGVNAVVKVLTDVIDVQKQLKIESDKRQLELDDLRRKFQESKAVGR